MRFRDARDQDYPAFQTFWTELIPDQPPPDEQRWRTVIGPATFFLEIEGELAAYACIYPLGERGDVRQIVVMPPYRNRGVGRALMTEVRRRLVAAGCRDWRLEVREDNAPAIALYRRVGMQVLYPIEVLRIGAADAARFAQTSTGGHPIVDVDPARDAEIETCFDLGRGALARFRKVRPHGAMYEVPGMALAHYTHDFAPDLALMFPLRAPDADLAAHLFAKACAIGVNAEIEMLVPDAPVGEALRAAGAHVRDRQLVMGAPL